MARRETYGADVKCPQCNTEGSATVEENENPVYSRGELNQKVEDVSGPFSISQDRKTIICDGCGKAAEW